MTNERISILRAHTYIRIENSHKNCEAYKKYGKEVYAATFIELGHNSACIFKRSIGGVWGPHALQYSWNKIPEKAC